MDSIPANNVNHIEISISTSSLDGSNNFKYYKSNGELVLSEGVNDYNKIDNRLIKSQQHFFSKKEVKLGYASTLIFKTNDGDFGKMQLKQGDKERYQLRYVN